MLNNGKEGNVFHPFHDYHHTIRLMSRLQGNSTPGRLEAAGSHCLQQGSEQDPQARPGQARPQNFHLKKTLKIYQLKYSCRMMPTSNQQRRIKQQEKLGKS